jgi:hypothetical protein
MVGRGGWWGSRGRQGLTGHGVAPRSLIQRLASLPIVAAAAAAVAVGLLAACDPEPVTPPSGKSGVPDDSNQEVGATGDEPTTVGGLAVSLSRSPQRCQQRQWYRFHRHQRMVGQKGIIRDAVIEVAAKTFPSCSAAKPWGVGVREPVKDIAPVVRLMVVPEKPPMPILRGLSLADAASPINNPSRCEGLRIRQRGRAGRGWRSGRWGGGNSGCVEKRCL